MKPTIYIVTYNGKVSQEAYQTRSEAQDFIKQRMGFESDDPAWFEAKDSKGNVYQIHQVRIKGMKIV